MVEAQRQWLKTRESRRVSRESTAADLRRRIEELRGQLSRYAEALEEDLSSGREKVATRTREGLKYEKAFGDAFTLLVTHLEREARVPGDLDDRAHRPGRRSENGGVGWAGTRTSSRDASPRHEERMFAPSPVASRDVASDRSRVPAAQRLAQGETLRFPFERNGRSSRGLRLAPRARLVRLLQQLPTPETSIWISASATSTTPGTIACSVAITARPSSHDRVL